MLRCAVHQSHRPDELERRINSWFQANPNVEVVEIRHSAAAATITVAPSPDQTGTQRVVHQMTVVIVYKV